MGQGNWKWSAGVVLISAHLDGPTPITRQANSTYDGACDLDQLAGGCVGIGEGAGLDEFYAASGSMCTA